VAPPGWTVPDADPDAEPVPGSPLHSIPLPTALQTPVKLPPDVARELSEVWAVMSSSPAWFQDEDREPLTQGPPILMTPVKVVCWAVAGVLQSK
jgi:hypothetical protein